MLETHTARLRLPLFLMAALCLAPALLRAGATVDVASPTTSWTAILYPNNSPDPSNDQQTGSSEGDIVGNATHPSVYTAFGDAGTLSTTDGTIAFRIRVGADTSPAGFKTAAFIGIDANNDGALDLFLGVNNSGSKDTIGIWDPGNGLNTSPNTTTIVSTPLMSYTQTASNYRWEAVTTTNDPTVGTATDLDGGGQNDFFLTFSIPFNDVVVQLAAKGITGFTQNSTLSYVISTATQANSLNQDLNGVGQAYDPAALWSSLGVVSSPISSSGIYAIPEPSVVLQFATGALIFAACGGWAKTGSGRRGPRSVSLAKA
ncbi:MAG: hypothetical protein QOG67_1687 [Verrucomicrobiota bacterium]|jgi:hypothetical protein